MPFMQKSHGRNECDTLARAANRIAPALHLGWRGDDFHVPLLYGSRSPRTGENKNAGPTAQTGTPHQACSPRSAQAIGVPIRSRIQAVSPSLCPTNSPSPEFRDLYFYV